MSKSTTPQFAVVSPIDGAVVRTWDTRADADAQAAVLTERMGRTYTVRSVTAR